MSKTFRHGGYEGTNEKFVTEAENQRLRRAARREDEDIPVRYKPEGAILYNGQPGSGSWQRKGGR